MLCIYIYTHTQHIYIYIYIYKIKFWHYILSTQQNKYKIRAKLLGEGKNISFTAFTQSFAIDYTHQTTLTRHN